MTENGIDRDGILVVNEMSGGVVGRGDNTDVNMSLSESDMSVNVDMLEMDNDGSVEGMLMPMLVMVNDIELGNEVGTVGRLKFRFVEGMEIDKDGVGCSRSVASVTLSVGMLVLSMVVAPDGIETRRFPNRISVATPGFKIPLPSKLPINVHVPLAYVTPEQLSRFEHCPMQSVRSRPPALLVMFVPDGKNVSHRSW